MSELSDRLGERIRSIRDKMNLSRAEFAGIVGMSEDALGLIERGETTPRLENLQKIASYVDMQVSELIDLKKNASGNASPKNTNRKIKTLDNFTAYLKTKSPEQIRMLHDVAISILDKKRR
ncbi:MAG: helix-turn-helix transcriptional regulator [Planctomycetes bacterium]|nr:helix-turn-helix transcriptional regulator [Planctomycetota bacterium]